MYARSHDSLIIQCFEKRRDVNITQLIDVKGQPSKTVKYHHKLIWFCGLFANLFRKRLNVMLLEVSLSS